MSFRGQAQRLASLPDQVQAGPPFTGVAMVSFSESSRNAAMISASIVVAAAILGAAHAATDTVFRYSSPQVGYFAIDNTDLSPDGTNSLAYFNEWDIAISPDDGQACFNTGIHLPQGAVINQFRVFYEGGAGSDKPFVTIQRKPYTTGINEPVAEQDLQTSATRAAMNITLNTSRTKINNASFSYGFGICLRNQNDKFYAARIRYTYETAGD
jgi:hypothetical protein